ncbi:MAG TPA: AEC family transporter [Nitrospirota bacterium]
MRHALSTAVFHFFIPALAFRLMATASVDRSFISIPLTGIAVVIISLALGFVLYARLPWLRDIPRPAFGVMMLSATFGNVLYMGLPVITETLGARYGYVAVLYDLLASTPILLTIGVFIASRYGSGKDVSIGASFKRVLKLPPLWGVVAGIGVRLSGVDVPQTVLDAADLMGKAVVPVMIFTVGLALDFHDVKRMPIALPALAIKLLVAPVLAWWIGSRLGLAGDTLKAATIEGAMPVMVLSLVIADEFELDVPLAAACITVSTVLLFFTMPVMMRVLFS